MVHLSFRPELESKERNLLLASRDLALPQPVRLELVKKYLMKGFNVNMKKRKREYDCYHFDSDLEEYGELLELSSPDEEDYLYGGDDNEGLRELEDFESRGEEDTVFEDDPSPFDPPNLGAAETQLVKARYYFFTAL